MKDIFTVTKFTMREMIKRKSFIISTLIILAMIVIGFNIPNIIGGFNENTSEISGKEAILVIDSNDIFEGTLEKLNEMNLKYEFAIGDKSLKFEDVKKAIQSVGAGNAIIINPNKGKINITYVVPNKTYVSEVPEECKNALNTLYSNLQLTKLGLSDEELQSIKPDFKYNLVQIEEQEASGNVVAIMLMSIVLFYAIYFCAFQVSSSITTEKTSKIMETLVTSTSPTTIVLGKTIGIGLVGLMQLVLIIATAIACANKFLDRALIESVLDLSNITPFLGIITIIYFLLGYLAYALLYALTGSTVSKPEDVQSANTPIAIIAVIGFYLSYFTMMNPTSDLNFWASILPISSAFCMPFRVMMGLASNKDIAMSIFILIATIIVIAKIAIKVYSSAILNYGTRLSLKDIAKIYKEK